MTKFDKITASPDALIEALRDEHGDVYPLTTCEICVGCAEANEDCEAGIRAFLAKEEQ